MATRVVNGILVDDECASPDYLKMIGITKEDLIKAPLYFNKPANTTETSDIVFTFSDGNNKNDKRPKEKTKVDLWAEWSLTPHTEDEIREKILTDYDGVCFSYLCGSSKLSETFIIELMALSTGLLNKENYQLCIDEMKKAVLIADGIERGEICYYKLPYISSPGSKAKKQQSLIDHLDWSKIFKYQTLSPEFRIKFAPLAPK